MHPAIVHQYTPTFSSGQKPRMLGSDWFEGNQGNEQPVGMAQYAQHLCNSQLLRGRGKPPTHSNVTYNMTIVDLINNSCLNGWTCGNIAATPMDIAMF
jgi:hypothetical protein